MNLWTRTVKVTFASPWQCLEQSSVYYGQDLLLWAEQKWMGLVGYISFHHLMYSSVTSLGSADQPCYHFTMTQRGAVSALASSDLLLYLFLWNASSWMWAGPSHLLLTNWIWQYSVNMLFLWLAYKRLDFDLASTLWLFSCPFSDGETPGDYRPCSYSPQGTEFLPAIIWIEPSRVSTALADIFSATLWVTITQKTQVSHSRIPTPINCEVINMDCSE